VSSINIRRNNCGMRKIVEVKTTASENLHDILSNKLTKHVLCFICVSQLNTKIIGLTDAIVMAGTVSTPNNASHNSIVLPRGNSKLISTANSIFIIYLPAEQLTPFNYGAI
jgi:hypothetical protein